MDNRENVQSVQRSFALLELLSARPEGMALAELSKEMGLAKSTAHRLLVTLANLGYVAQNGASGRYRATLRMFEIASGVMARFDVVAAAREHLDALSTETGEAVHLVVPDGPDIVYVYKSDAGSMRMSSRVGLRRPMYCTGVGKAILSTLSFKEVERIWNCSAIEALTENTLTALDDLCKQLALSAKRGWAVDDEENELGIRCVAVPLPGPDGCAAAAFSVTGLAAQMDAVRMGELAGRCMDVQNDIKCEMGLSTV